MVLWQSDLRISWRSQWFSLLLHGIVAAIVLLMPWPLSYTPLWLLLLSLVVFDSVRSQRRIHACRGEIKLMTDSRLRWQKADGVVASDVPPQRIRNGAEDPALSRIREFMGVQ